jgi:GST-like protein
MIVLYSLLSHSPNIRKISMMLNETGLPYTIQKFERQSDGMLPTDFMAINPNGTVPAILDEDNGAVIFESGAILHYLAEKTGKFLPSDLKTRGETVQWLIFETANMGPTLGELYHYMLRASEDIAEVHLQRYRDKVSKFCEVLERQLEGRDYLCGDYSIADMALFPWAGILEDMADVKLSDYPNLSAWVNRINRHPAAMATA